MSQQTETVFQRKPWVLLSVFKNSTKVEDLERITPEIANLVDEWHSKGKIMWFGAFNDNKTGMAVFEATEEEANDFYLNYDKVCSGVLDYSLYQWDAMPILSLLSR